MNYLAIAKKYAKKAMGWDGADFAISHNGYEYYCIFSSKLAGLRLGFPYYIKIDKQGNVFDVVEPAEKLWVFNHE